MPLYFKLINVMVALLYIAGADLLAGQIPSTLPDWFVAVVAVVYGMFVWFSAFAILNNLPREYTQYYIKTP